jgi:hypothetical protein
MPKGSPHFHDLQARQGQSAYDCKCPEAAKKHQHCRKNQKTLRDHQNLEENAKVKEHRRPA